MNKHILVLGAGRSAGSLINYLGKWTAKNNIQMTVADLNEVNLKEKTRDFQHINTVIIDPKDRNQLGELVSKSSTTVSLLPHSLHPKVAKECIKHSKNMATASYAKDEIKAFNRKAEKNDVTFLFELGADPGIDHLSACKLVNEVKSKNGIITGFKSFAGAVMSPENENDNPWKYKFTWNPMNVVIAGQGEMARYRNNSATYYIPYYRLFQELIEVEFPELGYYEAYANRNSLEYVHHYGIDGVPTILRGTIRRPGFGEAWHAMILLGATDNVTRIKVEKDYSFKEFYLKFAKSRDALDTKENFEKIIGIKISNDAWEKIKFLELDSDEIIPEGIFTPAEITEKLLLKKWKLNPKDKDLLIMYHELDYTLDNKSHKIISRMKLKGVDAEHTAISDTVGLPLAMGVKLLVSEKIEQKGVILPVYPEIYNPILKELEDYGIHFEETEE